MIPLRDDNPAQSKPVVTYALVAVNAVVFVFTALLSTIGHSPFTGFELVPARLFGNMSFPPIPISPWLTIFTAMFLHANLLHIGGNMLYLWIFGNNIEDALGHFKFLIFYFASGFGAAMAQVLMDPASKIPMVGASGAIAGVLAAYLILFPRARVTTLVFIFYFIQVTELPASLLLGWWIVIQVFNSLLAGSQLGGGVAYAAHVGGFASGALLILAFGGRRMVQGRTMTRYPRQYRWRS